MPRYDYECVSCGHRFEVRQGFQDEAVARCPLCQGSARRLISPVTVVYKGSGFYATDNRRGNHSGGSEAKPVEKNTPAPSDTKASNDTKTLSDTKASSDS